MKTHEIHQFINHDSEFFKILKQIPHIDEDGPWVAGGSVWKSIEQMPLNCDIDIFFKSPQQCEQWYRKLLSLPYVHRIVSDAKSNQYNTTLKYHVYDRGYNKTITLQLVSFKFFKNIESLLGDFDFTACQFGFDGRYLYTGDTSFDDLRNREIIFNNIADNVATGIHIDKYTKIGFKIPESQKQKYDEIMEKTKKFRDTNPCIEHASTRPSVRFTSNWGNSEPAVATPRPVAVDEDYAYPRPVVAGSDAVDLSRITARPTFTPVRPRESSLYALYGSPTSAWDGPTPSTISPGVYTTSIDSSLYTTNTLSIPMDYVTTVGTDNQNTPGIRSASEEFVGEPQSVGPGQTGLVYADYMPVCENPPLAESNDTMYGMATPSPGGNTI